MIYKGPCSTKKNQWIKSRNQFYNDEELGDEQHFMNSKVLQKN